MLRIYAMTHKKFDTPPDPLYVPLQVGSAVHDKLGYLCDDQGENISNLNCYYSELTGMYWIWKNVTDVKYVGTCHYRRYLVDEELHIFTKGQYLELLDRYDVITTRKVHLNNSYHYGFAANHNIVALDETGQVIKELYPDYYDTFERLVNGPDTYFGNILVTSKEKYDKYCQWLFSIFFEVQRRIDMETDKDDYHRRVFGFISEFLLYVWIEKNRYSVYECKVGMLGEKAETKEMKDRLALYFKASDIEGAKQYFLEQHKKRPDVMMEASDITGELHLAMQVIATADAEQRRYGNHILQKENDFKRLMQLFTDINRLVSHLEESSIKNNTTVETFLDERDLTTLHNAFVSDTALEIAKIIRPKRE